MQNASYDLLSGCSGHSMPYDSENLGRVTTRFEILRREDGRFEIILERKSLNGRWFSGQGIHSRTIPDDWLENGWEHFVWCFTGSYSQALFHYSADGLRARDDLRAFLGVRPAGGLRAMCFSHEFIDESFACRLERPPRGEASLLWRYRGRFGARPQGDEWNRLSLSGDRLTDWNRVKNFIRDRVMPSVCGAAAPANAQWKWTQKALSHTLSKADDGEACDIMGFTVQAPTVAVRGVPSKDELDLMQGKDEIELPGHQHLGYALRSYGFERLMDDSLWFHCLIVDYLSERTMPHGESYLLPHAWLAGGWEAFLDWFSDSFPAGYYIFTRDMLAGHGGLRSFLGL